MPKSYISHLECGLTGKADYAAGAVHNLSEAGRPLLPRYDLESLKNEVSKEEIWARPGGFWKWRELLPVQHQENIIRLGEEDTPLIPLPRLAKHYGHAGELIVKHEGHLPTASFKARGLGLAVSMAKELGFKRLAMPTNGNAGAALAAYASHAGMESFVFCPDDTPRINVDEIAILGANVWRVNGLIDDCGKIVADGQEKMDWFNLSTLKEPYRVEGKKTLGLEFTAQLGWEVPDVVFFPTGGGTAVVGMWKAFDEMEALGWIGSKRPKMIVVQAAGCAPLVKAFEEGERFAPRWEDAHTRAAGIRVPIAVGDFLVIDAARESGGRGVAVEEEAIFKAQAEIGAVEGVLVCPEAAACFVAFQQGLKEGWVSSTDRALIINSGSGLKYEMPDLAGTIDKDAPIDFDALLKG